MSFFKVQRKVEQPPTRPNVTVYTSWEEESTVGLLCILTGYYPDKLTVEWLLDNAPDTTSVQQKLHPADGEKTFSMSSRLVLDGKTFSQVSVVTCKATHNDVTYSRNTSICSGFAYPLSGPSIQLETPRFRTVMEQTVVTATCVVQSAFNAKVYWFLDGKTLDLTTGISESRTSQNIISNLTLQLDRWKELNNLTCRAEHHCFKTTQKTLNVENLFENPSIQLYLDLSNVNSHSMNQTLGCYGWGFNPKIKWLQDSKQISTTDSDIRIGEDGRMAVTSYITVTAKQWKEGKLFTCEVIDNELPKSVSKNISICEVTPASSQRVGLYLQGPPLQKLVTDGQLPVTCWLVGLSLRDFSVSWMVGGVPQEGLKQSLVEHSNGTQSLQIVTNVSASSWHAHKIVSCEVKHRCSIQAQVEQISKCRYPKPPSIQLVGPSDSDLKGSENVTLLCLVSGFFPSDIIVHWKHGGSDLASSHYSSSPPVQYVGSSTFSMNSRLIVPKSEWYHNSTYTCVVKHESSDIPINSTMENVFASVMTSPPTATLLQGTKELVCLVFGFSPSFINITWLLDNVTELSEHNTSTPYRGPDGKYSVWSHLSLAPQDWAAGAVYTCRVIHPTKTLSVNMSKPEIMEEVVFFDQNMGDPIQGDSAEDNWKMTVNFIILFLISLLYSITLTLAKAKSRL